MSKYKHLDKYLEKKGKAPKAKAKKDKKFKDMVRAEKDELLEKLLINLGYIE
jgi:hypothetical protein